MKAGRNVHNIKGKLILFYCTKSSHILIYFYVNYDFWYMLVLSFPIVYLFVLFSCSFLFLSFLLLFLSLVSLPPSLPFSSPTLSLQTMCLNIILRFFKLLIQRNSSCFMTFSSNLGFPSHSFFKETLRFWGLKMVKA